MFQNWLQPIDPHHFKIAQLANFQFGKQIQFYTDSADLMATKVGLIGIGEAETDAIRQALYELVFPFEQLKIVDFGNVRKTDTAFIIPLIKAVQESKIFPILLSNTPLHSIAQYKALQGLKQLSFIHVDERIPFAPKIEDKNIYYLNDIVKSKRERLFHLGLIGGQAHYIPPSTFKYLEKRNFDCIRLGKAKQDLIELEPIIRNGDLLSFNLSAIKQIEAPGQSKASPNGFTIEEACQISRYAGMSDKLKSFGIYGFRKTLDRKAQTAQAVAQMVWYFLDGFYNRKNDFPVSNEGLVEYIVDFKELDYQLTFWKSNKSGRWWMQIPVKSKKNIERHRLIPCSYNDYRLASMEELPDRLFNALKRFT